MLTASSPSYDATPTLTAGVPGLGDRFLRWLGWVLLGYALLSRGFAYLGVPPIYVGEATLLFGLLAMARSQGILATLTRLPAQLLALSLLWGLACTLPHLGTHGIDALRDAVLWAYGLFAFIVAALVIAHPYRLRALLVRYRTFAYVFLSLIWAVFLLYKLTNGAGLPTVPGTKVALLSVKGGDVMVHLTGITVFMLVGMMRPTVPVMLLLGFNLVLCVVSDRAGMVAWGFSLFVVILLRPPRLRLSRLVFGGVLMLTLLGLLNPQVTINGRRSISVEQMWINLVSVFGESKAGYLEGTKEWRLAWWNKIIDYTFNGPYFWMGKGYGVNLANADGFQVYEDQSLRSPHNGHLTFLARSGVPGFVLWLLVLATWLGAVVRAYLHARRHGDEAWCGIFLFLLAYWLACLVNASFDVFLEGPMGGIWFWTLYGLGIAATYLYRHTPEVAWEEAAS